MSVTKVGSGQVQYSGGPDGPQKPSKQKGKTSGGRKVGEGEPNIDFKAPKGLRPMMRKLGSVVVSVLTGKKDDANNPPLTGDTAGLSANYMAEAKKQAADNRALLNQIRQGTKLQGSGTDAIDAATTAKALAIAGNEIREARDTRMMEEYVFSDPRYAKVMAQVADAEAGLAEYQSKNAEMETLQAKIAEAKTLGRSSVNPEMAARVSELNEELEAMTDNTLLASNRQELQREVQGVIVDILREKVAGYEDEVLKNKGTATALLDEYQSLKKDLEALPTRVSFNARADEDSAVHIPDNAELKETQKAVQGQIREVSEQLANMEHDHEYFGLISLLNSAMAKYVDLAQPAGQSTFDFKGTLQSELQGALKKRDSEVVMQKLDALEVRANWSVHADRLSHKEGKLAEMAVKYDSLTRDFKAGMRSAKQFFLSNHPDKARKSFFKAVTAWLQKKRMKKTYKTLQSAVQQLRLDMGVKAGLVEFKEGGGVSVPQQFRLALSKGFVPQLSFSQDGASATVQFRSPERSDKTLLDADALRSELEMKQETEARDLKRQVNEAITELGTVMHRTEVLNQIAAQVEQIEKDLQNAPAQNGQSVITEEKRQALTGINNELDELFSASLSTAAPASKPVSGEKEEDKEVSSMSELIAQMQAEEAFAAAFPFRNVEDQDLPFEATRARESYSFPFAGVSSLPFENKGRQEPYNPPFAGVDDQNLPMETKRLREPYNPPFANATDLPFENKGRQEPYRAPMAGVEDLSGEFDFEAQKNKSRLDSGFFQDADEGSAGPQKKED